MTTNSGPRRPAKTLLGKPLDDLPPTLTAEQIGEIFGLSTYSVYSGARKGDLPVAPIRVGGRLLRWPTASVLRVLGLVDDREHGPGAA
jgi:predicted DNA-binding transcriptional regulator AlpA